MTRASQAVASMFGVAFAAAVSAQVPPQPSAAKQHKVLFNKGFAACLEGKGYTVK